MKKLIIIIIALLILSSKAFAADWQVTQADPVGACDVVDRACSVAEFNALTGAGYAGDTFYFSGTFTTGVTVNISGTSGSEVTLDGYEVGNTAPLTDVWTSSNGALLNAGMLTGGAVSYLIIQDFRITKVGYAQDYGFSTYPGRVDHLIFRRNYVNDTSCRGVDIGSDSGDDSEYIIIEENKIFNFAMRNETPGECTGFDLYRINHVLVRNNVMGHDGGSVGCSTGCNTATLFHAEDILFEYNDISGAPQQAGVHPKELGSHFRHIYRFNKIHDNAGAGMSVGDGVPDHKYMYIYGNYVYSNGDIGIFPLREFQDMYIWSNIIANNTNYGIAVYGTTGTGTNLNIINNTIVRNSTAGADPAYTGMSVYFGSGHTAKNNLLWNNRTDGASGLYHQIYDTTGMALEHNTLWHDSELVDKEYWYYNSGVQDLSDMQALSLEDDAPAGVVTDNLGTAFTDPDGANITHGDEDDDYTLVSNGLTDGADLSYCFTNALNRNPVDLSGGDAWMETNSGYGQYIEPCYDDALDPIGTDWTTTPPTVATVKRDTYGWERGAYAYLGPVLSSSSIPANGLSITLNFNEAVFQGSAYSNAHWNLDCSLSGSGIAMSYVSGNGTISHTYSLPGAIRAGETCNVDFSGTTDSMENSLGADLAEIVDGEVTNSSTVTVLPMAVRMFFMD